MDDADRKFVPKPTRAVLGIAGIATEFPNRIVRYHIRVVVRYQHIRQILIDTQ